MVSIHDIISELEKQAPLIYQEDYDNSGLLAGDRNAAATGVLLSLDCTEAVVEEAIKNNCNLVISHHPLIFSGLKKVTGSNFVERTLIKAIKNDVALYACHTNIDNIITGVNRKIADKLGLKNTRILAPKTGLLRKLVTYVPASHQPQVMQALFDAGAGNIGNYDSCSFSASGTGTFRGNQNSTPFIGKPGELSREEEIRIETIFEVPVEKQVISSLLNAHPYEEVAYDVYTLTNRHAAVGSGMTGEFSAGMAERDFLELIKKTLKAPFVKHTALTGKTVKKVVVCGGSGRFLLKNAIAAGADAYVTADFKYHEFFDAEGKLLLVDTGHYESEQFTAEIFYEIIQKKFPTFAIHLSKINTNPVNYF